MKILIATRNTGKLDEIRAIFQVPGIELLSLADFPDLPEIEEDGDTFIVNAIKKAVTLAMLSKCWALADDSGLCVDILGGRPGVRSARYSGQPVDHGRNIKKLLQEMEHKTKRSAHFMTVIALSSPAGRSQIVEGRCDGTLTTEPQGGGGFGYDPIFIPKGETRTFAEMPAEEKNRLSHRAMALQKAIEAWRPCFESDGKLWT